jgi:predicted nucleic acid-binding protein
MRIYFYDASALAKLVVPEAGSRHVLAHCGTADVIRTTWLSLAETYGVLKRYWTRGEWDKQRYYSRVWALQHNYQQRIPVDGPVDLPYRQFQEMERLLKAYDVDYSDALHLVFLKSGLYARMAGDSAPVLVAADQKLLKVATEEGVTTWNPEAEECPPG